ncbi:MAG: flagellar hook-length control protein FliK [Actinomycetota bacterium]
MTGHIAKLGLLPVAAPASNGPEQATAGEGERGDAFERALHAASASSRDQQEEPPEQDITGDESAADAEAASAEIVRSTDETAGDVDDASAATDLDVAAADEVRTEVRVEPTVGDVRSAPTEGLEMTTAPPAILEAVEIVDPIDALMPPPPAADQGADGGGDTPPDEAATLERDLAVSAPSASIAEAPDRPEGATVAQPVEATSSAAEGATSAAEQAVDVAPAEAAGVATEPARSTDDASSAPTSSSSSTTDASATADDRGDGDGAPREQRPAQTPAVEQGETAPADGADTIDTAPAPSTGDTAAEAAPGPARPVTTATAAPTTVTSAAPVEATAGTTPTARAESAEAVAETTVAEDLTAMLGADGGEEAEGIWRQVRRAMGSLRTNQAGEQLLTVRLRPAELGAVTVRVVTGDNGTAISLVAESAAAATQLQQQRQLLTSDLESSGLRGIALDIGAGNGAGDGPGTDGDGTDAQQTDGVRELAEAYTSAGTAGGEAGVDGERRRPAGSSRLIDIDL